MSSAISLFPVLTDDLVQKIGMQEYEPKFYFHDENGCEQLLTQVPMDSPNTFKLENNWDFDEHDLIFEEKISVENADYLFGKNGIACQDAKLGFAVEWMSPSSRQRGTVAANDVLEFHKGSEELSVRLEFEKAQLRGQVMFRLVLFIKNIGRPSLEERHLANQCGLILGELSSFIVEIDGNGSEFPIFIVNNPGRPLWYLKSEWNDPVIDSFNDCVSIYINEANPNYKYLDEKNKLYDPHLITEIVAHAMMIVIMKLKDNPEHWQAVNNADLSQPGSVCKAVSYFLSFEDVDKSNMETISLTLRKYLETRM